MTQAPLVLASVTQTASSAALPLNFSDPVTAGNTVIIIAIGALFSNNPPAAPEFAGPTLNGASVAGAFPLWVAGGNNGVVTAGGGTDAALSGWVLPNCPAGNGINFATFHPAQIGFVGYEVSGLGVAPAIDVASSAESITGTAISSGVTGPAAAAGFVVAGAGAVSGAAAGDPSFTSTTPNANSWAGYLIGSPGGSYTWEQTGIGSAPWAAGIAALKNTDTPPPDVVPPDTDQYIYRYVTKWRGEQIISELTQIAISQP